MRPPLLPRLRRHRTLLMLALCAWLMLVAAGWARSPVGDCCGGMVMTGHAAMVGHADLSMDGHDGAHALHTTDCSCPHACVSMLRVDNLAVPASAPATPYLVTSSEGPPQRVANPPLRPPLA